MPQYLRAYAERADADAKAGTPIRFVCATEGRKGDRIDLRMAGVDLARFRANPVVLWCHQYSAHPPIAMASEMAVDADRLLADITFDQADPMAVAVERKYRSGFMNAVSIGFDVTRWENPEDSYWRGGVALEWELNEISCVPVPMDPDAMVDGERMAMRSLGRELLEITRGAPAAQLLEVHAEALDLTEPIRAALAAALPAELARLGVQIPPPASGEQQPDATPAQGIDTTAARDLLAAFALERGNA